MPGGSIPGVNVGGFGPDLLAFVENGTIAETRVDDMVERIVAAWYLLGQDNNYPAGVSRSCTLTLLGADISTSELQSGSAERPGHEPARGCAR